LFRKRHKTSKKYYGTFRLFFGGGVGGVGGSTVSLDTLTIISVYLSRIQILFRTEIHAFLVILWLF